MKIVTVGGGFLDIDGLAAGVAYAELLNVQGKQAVFVSTGGMNESVTPTIRSWGLPLKTAYEVNKDDRFIVVDNSAPDWLELFVTDEKIDEIIDHHLGHEAYWQSRGVATDIQFIGAASTLVYERWKKAGRLQDMSELSARLLWSGILDNTLNFKASVTTERDRQAARELQEKSGFGNEWAGQYFDECQQGIEQRLPDALKNDTKRGITYPGYEQPVNISQLVVWDGKRLLEKTDELLRLTELYGIERSIHLISISEGKNYFITPSVGLRHYYGHILDIRYDGEVAASDRLWLRKEIMKEAIRYG